MKLGIWLAIAVVAWLWFGHLRRQQLRGRGQGTPLHPAQPDPAASGAGTAEGANAHPVAIQSIVACAHCGVHVPLSEAVVTPDGARFCGQAHRRLHPLA